MLAPRRPCFMHARGYPFAQEPAPRTPCGRAKAAGRRRVQGAGCSASADGSPGKPARGAGPPCPPHAGCTSWASLRQKDPNHRAAPLPLRSADGAAWPLGPLNPTPARRPPRSRDQPCQVRGRTAQPPAARRLAAFAAQPPSSLQRPREATPCPDSRLVWRRGGFHWGAGGAATCHPTPVLSVYPAERSPSAASAHQEAPGTAAAD